MDYQNCDEDQEIQKMLSEKTSLIEIEEQKKKFNYIERSQVISNDLQINQDKKPNEKLAYLRIEDNTNCGICYLSFDQTKKVECSQCKGAICTLCSRKKFDNQNVCDICYMKQTLSSQTQRKKQMIEQMINSYSVMRQVKKNLNSDLIQTTQDLITLSDKSDMIQNNTQQIEIQIQEYDKQLQYLTKLYQQKNNEIEQLEDNQIESLQNFHLTQQKLIDQDKKQKVKENEIMDKKQELDTKQNQLEKVKKDKIKNQQMDFIRIKREKSQQSNEQFFQNSEIKQTNQYEQLAQRQQININKDSKFASEESEFFQSNNGLNSNDISTIIHKNSKIQSQQKCICVIF